VVNILSWQKIRKYEQTKRKSSLLKSGVQLFLVLYMHLKTNAV
jgi:hypothetical protein